jgi:hypothetical protein
VSRTCGSLRTSANRLRSLGFPTLAASVMGIKFRMVQAESRHQQRPHERFAARPKWHSAAGSSTPQDTSALGLDARPSLGTRRRPRAAVQSRECGSRAGAPGPSCGLTSVGSLSRCTAAAPDRSNSASSARAFRPSRQRRMDEGRARSHRVPVVSAEQGEHMPNCSSPWAKQNSCARTPLSAPGVVHGRRDLREMSH